MGIRKEKKYWEDGEVLTKSEMNGLNEFVLGSIANTWHSNLNIAFGIEFLNSEPQRIRDGNWIIIPPFFAIFKSGYQVVSEKNIEFDITGNIPVSNKNFTYLELEQTSGILNENSFKLIVDPEASVDKLVFSKYIFEINQGGNPAAGNKPRKVEEYLYPSINLFKQPYLVNMLDNVIGNLLSILKKINNKLNETKNLFFFNQLYTAVINVLCDLKKVESIQICSPFDFYHHLKQIVLVVDSFPGKNEEYYTVGIINSSFNFNDSYASFEKIKNWIRELDRKL